MLGNESSNKLEHYPSLLLVALQEAIASGVRRSKGWAMLYCDQNLCPGFFGCVNKTLLVAGWRDNLMDGWLCRFGLAESAKMEDGL